MPIYLQIIEAIKYHVATGTLSPHDELPSVRSLAKEYLINPNTVARAYLELERDGMIYKKRGMGTFVAEKETSMSQQEKMKEDYNRMLLAHCLSRRERDIIFMIHLSLLSPGPQ